MTRDPFLSTVLSTLFGRTPRPGGGAGDHGHAGISLPGSDVDPGDFRRAMSDFPSAVSVVTALDERGAPRGLTCSAVCSLSMAPPSMLLCVNRRNRSLEAIRHSGGFVVNPLRSGRDEVAALFASSSPAKFDPVPWRPSPASGLPVLAADALAFVDCRLETEIEAASHVILVGLVRRAGPCGPAAGPLVYWRREYGAWTPSVPGAPGGGAGEGATPHAPEEAR